MDLKPVPAVPDEDSPLLVPAGLPTAAVTHAGSDTLSVGPAETPEASDGSRLRVAVVTESFLPTGNGVTTSVCRVLEHLQRRGHEAIVICPGPAPTSYAGAPVVSVPAMSYRSFPIGLPVGKVARTLATFAPDVVHAASPFVLGARGLHAAHSLGIPAVAVYQTDVPGFATSHHAQALAPTAWSWIRWMHERADLTLAPSRATRDDLRAHAVPRVRLWARGVDGERFTPTRRQSPAVQELRQRLTPHGEVLVGYVGRLAAEKRVERLAALAGMPGVRVVIGGDGPSRRSLERTLGPQGAAFLGWLDGDGLADAYAALDVFVHTGAHETFGQTLQEALASGVPVVAPASGGPLDLVQPGHNGLLYPPDDSQAMRAAVERLANDPERRQWMATAARAGVERRTWQTLGDELIGHYRSVIAARRRAR